MRANGSNGAVACVGGPLHGQWFWTEDWDERLSSAAYMTGRGPRVPVALEYVRTGRTIPNPDQAGLRGVAWRHNSLPEENDD